MKQKIDRITAGAKSISLRTLAMVPCFIMLLSAIGVGTVVTAIAKSSNAKAAAAGALSRAVADVAVEEDEEDDIVIGKKGKADLAGTGWDTSQTYYVKHNAVDNWKTDTVMMKPGSDYSVAYYIFYLKYGDGTDNQFRWRYYIGNENAQPKNSNNIMSGSSGEYDGFENGDYRYWYIPTTSDQFSNDGLYRAVKVGFNSSGSSKTWYSISKLNEMATTIKANNSTSNTSIRLGESVTLSASTTNLSSYYNDNGAGGYKSVYTFQVKKDSGSYSDYGNKISRTGSNATTSGNVTWTPAETGTYKFRVYANDDNLVPGNNTKSGNSRYGLSSEITITVLPDVSYNVTLSDSGTVGTQKSAAATVSSASASEGTTITVNTNQRSGYRANVTVTDSDSGNVSVTKVTAKQFTFTMPAKNVTVNVTYEEVGYVPVKVYAGTGGSVEVTYNSKVIATVAAGDHTTVQAFEGDTLTLAATAGTGYDFNKWKKNINESYSTTATINETVAENLVYVAAFKLESSSTTTDWIASSSKIEASPRTATTSESTSRYSYGSSDTGLSTGNYTVTKTGTTETIGYWADITSILPSSSEHLYFALSGSNNPSNDICGNGSDTINTVSTSSTVSITDSSGNVLFKVEPKTNGTYNNSGTRYMHIYSLDTSKVSAIGVMTYFNKSSGFHGNSAHYQFYYKLKASSSSDVDTSYSPAVTYYAKDGVVRKSSGTINTAQFGTTTVTDQTDVVTVNPSRSKFNGGQDSETWIEGKATKGMPIKVTTTVDDAYKDKYYVAGFSFNGVTPKVFKPTDSNPYTCTYIIPEDLDGSKLEITPIYFLKDSTNCINFYIDGYNDSVKTNWGNELYVYPFYQYYKNGVSGTVTDLAGQAENFRAYPGQPVINNGGRRYIQIPLTDDGTADGYRVKGVTINNGYWDHVHGNTAGTGDGHEDDGMGADFVNVHRQTYDYDDFYKIYNEYGKNGAKTLNNIYFTFKYRTDADQHRGTYADGNSAADKVDQRADNAATLTSATGHHFELLKDNFGNAVDLFGTKLSTAAMTTYENKEMYVISEGYEANNAGKFATEWAVYSSDNGTFTRVTSAAAQDTIVPSALVISSADRVSDTAYPALDGDIATSGFKTMYEALEEYRGIPVMICYETELHGGSKSGGYDPAYRSDGRWTFTKTTDYIKANVKIEYINEAKGISSYTEDPYVAGSDVGQNTGAKAYFTYVAGESGYGATEEGKTSLSGLPINDNKYFNFKAETAGSYEFVGWYSVDTNGDYHAVNNDVLNKVTGHSVMSSDSIFVARFKFVASGSLTISHTLAAGNSGRAETYLGVYVDDVMIADENSNTDSVKLSNQYINSSNTADIKVVLRTVPNGENVFNAFTAKKTDTSDNTTDITTGQTFFNGSNVDSGGTVTREITFSIDSDVFSSSVQQVNALSYYSALTAATNKYQITYNFVDRFGDTKAYTVKGIFTEGELKAYFTGTGTSKEMTEGAVQFFKDHVPHESNFQKTLTWTLNSNSDVVGAKWTDVGSNTYNFTASVNSTQAELLTKRAVFDVPYEVVDIDSTSKDYNAKEEVSGTVSMLADDAHVTFEMTTEYGKWFENLTDGSAYSAAERFNEKLIKAPETIVNNETTMYFSYWKVSKLDNYGKGGEYVTKCYFPSFNLSAYDNYYIEAVYDDNAENAYNSITESTSGMQTTITFLEDSRNQWNNSSKGDSDAVADARDIIYNDFALSFQYYNQLLSSYSGAGTNDVRLGMIVQKLGEAEMSGSEHIGTIAGYEAKYQNSVAGTITTLENTALKSEMYTNGKWANIKYDGSNKYLSLNHVIAANNETITGVSDFNETLIDNKNRTEYYFSLDNSQGQNADLTAKNVYTNKMYVYRAFSYIMVNDNGSWTVKVSEKPAYFCMYDRATMVH